MGKKAFNSSCTEFVKLRKFAVFEKIEEKREKISSKVGRKIRTEEYSGISSQNVVQLLEINEKNPRAHRRNDK